MSVPPHRIGASHATDTDPRTRALATRAVARRARDTTEAAELLAMLGLLTPTPDRDPVPDPLAGLRTALAEAGPDGIAFAELRDRFGGTPRALCLRLWAIDAVRIDRGRWRSSSLPAPTPACEPAPWWATRTHTQTPAGR